MTSLNERFSAGRRTWLTSGIALGATTMASPLVLAQAPFASKPITLIVPFAAGGTVDNVARTVASVMTARLGQTVIVENTPGAGANIGAARAAAARPDGYTCLLLTTAHAINVSLYSQPGYSLKSFEPIGRIGESPVWLFVGANSPIKTFQDLVRRMKATPGRLSFGSGGSGTTSHLAVELFMRRFGLMATHVPYKSSPQIYTDLIAGRIDFAMNPVTGTDGLVRSGQLHALAVAAEKRIPSFPDVPTFTERGYAGVDVSGWYGLVVPAGVPDAVAATLEAALRAAVNDAKVSSALLGMGTSVHESNRQEFGQFVQAESRRWADLTTKAGIKLD